MPYLDYSLPEVADYSEGLKKIGDALGAMRQRQIQREQFEQKMQFEREDAQRKFAQNQANIQYQQDIENRKERMGQLEFRQRQNVFEDTKRREVNRLIGEGKIKEAQQVWESTRLYDPATAKEISRGKFEAGPMRDIGPEPTAQPTPGMPPEIAARFRGEQMRRGGTMPAPEEGAFVGPIPSAEELRYAQGDKGVDAVSGGAAGRPDIEAYLQAAEAERQGQEAQRKRYETQFEAYSQEFPAPDQTLGPTAADAQYDQQLKAAAADQASLPQRQAAYGAQKRLAEAERPYTISMGDRSSTVDMATERYATRELQAQDFADAYGPTVKTENDKVAFANAYAAIKSGVPVKTATDQFMKERAGLMVEQGKNTRAAGHDATTIEAAKIRASAASMDWKELLGRGNLAIRTEEAGKKEFQDFLRNQGYKADLAGMKDLIDSKRSLGLKNSMLDIGAGAAIARKANGSGVLTNQDMSRFWDAIGGVGARPENWFEQAITGQMGDEKRRIVLEGVYEKIDQEEARLRNIAVQADKFLANEKWWPGVRAAYFSFVNPPEMGPAAGPRIGTLGVPRAAPPEVKARVKAKAKGEAVDPVLEALKALGAQ